MRAKELRVQTTEQLQQTKSVLESDLLHHVATVAANAGEAKHRREIRKDLARVLTLLNQK
ncbi:MAG: 50S ribosomal protein L29 [Planctomycetaceae bacterium]|nr:50S ribosomal protein L29 [Planctomycetaceae bacterium]